jgi:hypothetical protein
VDWIRLGQDRNRSRDAVKTVMNPGVKYRQGIS